MKEKIDGAKTYLVQMPEAFVDPTAAIRRLGTEQRPQMP
jgi:hypothetical protein